MEEVSSAFYHWLAGLLLNYQIRRHIPISIHHEHQTLRSKMSISYSMVPARPVELAAHSTSYSNRTQRGVRYDSHSRVNHSRDKSDHPNRFQPVRHDLVDIHKSVQDIKEDNRLAQITLASLNRGQRSVLEKINPLERRLELQVGTVASISRKLTRMSEDLPSHGQMGEFLGLLDRLSHLVNKCQQNEARIYESVQKQDEKSTTLVDDLAEVLNKQEKAEGAINELNADIAILREELTLASLKSASAAGEIDNHIFRLSNDTDRISSDMEELMQHQHDTRRFWNRLSSRVEDNAQQVNVHALLEKHFQDSNHHQVSTAQRFDELNNTLAFLNGILQPSNCGNAALRVRISILEENEKERAKTQHNILASLLGMEQAGNRLKHWEEWQTDWSEGIAAWNSRLEDKLDSLISRERLVQSVENGKGKKQVEDEAEVTGDGLSGDEGTSAVSIKDSRKFTALGDLFPTNASSWFDLSLIFRWVGPAIFMISLIYVLFGLFTGGSAPAISQDPITITKVIKTTTSVAAPFA